MTKGFIYILGNNSMPGLLKIGVSTKVPTERKDELYTTGVPEPFELFYYCLVENALKLEREIHNNLSYCRNVTGREFFRVELEVAIETIRSLCECEHQWYESEVFEQAVIRQNEVQALLLPHGRGRRLRTIQSDY